ACERPVAEPRRRETSTLRSTLGLWCTSRRIEDCCNFRTGRLRMNSRTHLRLRRRSRALVTIIAATVGAATAALAGPREQAQRIHDRLAGVPPSDAVLDQMATHIENGNPLEAALLATRDRHFYTVTLKNFAAPWTNRDQSPFVPLNDYTTLVIGLVKDNEPFDQILYADALYVAPAVSPPPSATSNAHYEALEQRMLDPSFDPVTQLQRTEQSSVYPVPAHATAG